MWLLYGPRFNLVNEEERTNLYAAVTHEMDNGVTVRGELGFVKNEVLDNPQSPSYPNLSFPTISQDRPVALSTVSFVGMDVHLVRKRLTARAT